MFGSAAVNRSLYQMGHRLPSVLTNDQIASLCPSAMALEPHQSRSDRYVYIPTVKVIDGMRDAGFNPVKALQCKTRDASRSEFTKHIIRFQHRDSAAFLERTGGALPEIVLVNAHDGSSAYKLMFGVFVLVCSNGLIKGDISDSVNVQHKGNIIDAVIDGSNRILGNADRTAGVIEDWQRLQLTSGEQHALAVAAHTVRFGETQEDGTVKVDTPISADQLLNYRRQEDNKPDLWHTMNRIQENVIRGGLSAVRRTTDERGRRHSRRVSTRQVNGIDQDVKLNRAIWTLAENMAALKAQQVA